VQLWVNLPAAYKMSQPRYQGILNAAIPRVELGQGIYGRVIAVNLFDVGMDAGASGALTLPAGHNSAVVLLRGEITLNGPATLKGAAQVAPLSVEGDSVLLDAAEESLVLILSGEPIN